MALEFLYTQPVKIWFGRGRLGQLGDILDSMKLRRCMVVCDRFLRERVDTMLGKIPALCAVFSEIEENPQLHGVEQVVSLIREHKADAVLGIGGGSTMDTAKFAAAIANGEGKAIDYFRGNLPFPDHPLPILTVPSTAGTGSEVTQVSVISHGTEKKTINNPVFMPAAAIVDPTLSFTVPPRTTMNTGLDALAHALEGYWSKNHQPISDLMAIEAVRLVLENLETAWRDGTNETARENMSLAALLGGLSFALPKTAGCHACSYPLSEDYHLPHGEACAFTLDSFVRINADARLETLCQRVGMRNTGYLADKILYLKELAGLRTRLSDLCVPGTSGARPCTETVDLDKLARDCAAHPLMRNNPVRMDEAALRRMFETLQ